jgi:hypothetical protein
MRTNASVAAQLFGLSEVNLVAEYNTIPFPIQRTETFLKDAKEVALRSNSRKDFEATLRQQQQSKAAHSKQELEDVSLHVVARSYVGVLDSKNPYVLSLLQDPSLEGLANYFSATARARKTSPDAVCDQSQPTFLPPSKRSKKSVDQRSVLKIRHSGVQKKSAHDSATASKKPRRSARLEKKS